MKSIKKETKKKLKSEQNNKYLMVLKYNFCLETLLVVKKNYP